MPKEPKHSLYFRALLTEAKLLSQFPARSTAFARERRFERAVHQAKYGNPTGLNLLHGRGGLFLRQHQVVRPGQHLVQAAGEQPADVWNGLENEIAVGPVDGTPGGCAGRTLLTSRPLPIRCSSKRHHRAFAKIVGVFLECQPNDADPLRRQIEDRLDRRA